MFQSLEAVWQLLTETRRKPAYAYACKLLEQVLGSAKHAQECLQTSIFLPRAFCLCPSRSALALPERRLPCHVAGTKPPLYCADPVFLDAQQNQVLHGKSAGRASCQLLYRGSW